MRLDGRANLYNYCCGGQTGIGEDESRKNSQAALTGTAEGCI
jgi:hypothetical protein